MDWRIDEIARPDGGVRGALPSCAAARAPRACCSSVNTARMGSYEQVLANPAALREQRRRDARRRAEQVRVRAVGRAAAHAHDGRVHAAELERRAQRVVGLHRDRSLARARRHAKREALAAAGRHRRRRGRRQRPVALARAIPRQAAATASSSATARSTTGPRSSATSTTSCSSARLIAVGHLPADHQSRLQPGSRPRAHLHAPHARGVLMMKARFHFSTDRPARRTAPAMQSYCENVGDCTQAGDSIGFRRATTISLREQSEATSEGMRDGVRRVLRVHDRTLPLRRDHLCFPTCDGAKATLASCFAARR